MGEKTSWDFEEFRAILQKTHDKGAIATISSFLDSIYFKIYSAAYHKEEANQILDEMLGCERYSTGIELIFEQVTGTEKGKSFQTACKKSEAHIVAYAQCLHSSIDILGNVIVYALPLEALLKDRKWSIHGVKNGVSKLHNTESLTQKIEILLSSDIFNYIASYTNSQKHVKHLDMPFTAHSCEELCRAGIQLAPFTCLNYKNDEVPYEAKWADDLFEESKFILEGITNVGNNLSDYLRK